MGPIFEGICLIFTPWLFGVDLSPNPKKFLAYTRTTTRESNGRLKGAPVRVGIGIRHVVVS
jgi:hypothetical protein